MSLSVGAIRNYSNMNYVKNHARQNKTNNAINNTVNNNPSFTGKYKNGLRNAAIGAVALVAVPPMVSSCESEAEAFAYAENKCCHHHIHKPDTVYLPGDTVYQIIYNNDTVKIKDDFKSPVIDSINAILDDLDIDHGDGYIPLKISFVDEMDTKYRKYLFDGDASAPDQVVYRGKRSPYDDNLGQFVIGTPLDESENYLASLTHDGKLYLMKMIPRPGITDPKGMDDFMVAPQSFILDRQNAAKVIRKLGVSNTQSGREDLGIMEKGEIPKSIKLTNPYGTTWRYTNFDVESADAPKSSKY